MSVFLSLDCVMFQLCITRNQSDLLRPWLTQLNHQLDFESNRSSQSNPSGCNVGKRKKETLAGEDKVLEKWFCKGTKITQHWNEGKQENSNISSTATCKSSECFCEKICLRDRLQEHIFRGQQTKS